MPDKTFVWHLFGKQAYHMIQFDNTYNKLLFAILLSLCCETLFSQKDSLYNIKRLKADSSFEFYWSVEHLLPKDSVKFNFSKKLYLEALFLKTNDTYSKKRIIEINRILDKIELDKVCLEYKYNIEHNRIYHIKNLEESLIQLDSILCSDVKNKIKTLANKQQMIKYHFSLGLYLRNYMIRSNNELREYFFKRGVRQFDGMSSIILDCYYDWINGKRDAWKEWEENNKEIQ